MTDHTAVEVNFDGLIGPTHSYAGLSDGNLASAKNEGAVSRPRDAALQGLEKMRLLVKAGLVQGFLPPQPRPVFDLLRASGLDGDDAAVISKAAADAPDLLKRVYSASPMWTANAATVSPSPDTVDGLLHLTTANLSTMPHRALEHTFTTARLRQVFSDARCFRVHSALPQSSPWADEGAANHVRLCEHHGAAGVELFVFGREADASANSRFPARQTRLASQTIANSHGLNAGRTVFARQGQAAIDAGAFHNDVVCVGALQTLFYHELAFEDRDQMQTDIKQAAKGLFEPSFVEVPQAEVPIEDAISSYLFNSQLLQWPGEDRLVLLAPMETAETASTKAFCDRMTDGNGPIGRVEYVDVRQSMRNGGGPACLRLRVVMTEAERAACNPAYVLNEAKIDRLQEWVRGHYRETLAPTDLADPSFASEALTAVAELDALIATF